jgi:DNA repair exonuclease SbcCD nuclease subunit
MGNSDGIYYASMFIDNLVQIAREKNCTLLLLHGTYSHDADQLKLFYHYMEDKSVDVRVVTQIQFEQIKNMRLLCIPELYEVEESVYKEVLHHSGWYDECIIHGTFEGSVYGNNVGNGRLFSMKDFDLCTGFIIGGHVHKPGCFSGYFYYCGCPYRWKFGEEEDKGFLVAIHDLDTGYQDIHFEKIISHTYITVDLKDIISNDPQQVISYIDTLKKEKGIDYLKVKFKYPVEGPSKVIINNYYRNSRTIFIEFMSIMEEQKSKVESGQPTDEEYNFMLNDKISDMEKYVMYVNMKEGYEFVTVDKLKEILAEEI